ncbi:MAG TPA: hybrid sensor histidine kinase/response regulator [Tepidisphaeraceae bacterium]|nr:hybrid sensor histidine kinase/response regulator [Tepidisphaeraceae bacterium]
MHAPRHTLLVLDDEPDVVKSVQDLLRLDYRVLGATRATDAMEMMANEEVHLVMTDQRMPEMTGVEFLKKVRGEYPEAIRLLFTGYADIRAVIDAINQGNVYRYITKPWDPDELQSIIKEASDRYDLLVERNRLTTMLQEKNRNLEAANAELKRSNELKQAFIQVVSHELRTPLTILLGVTRLTVDSVPADSPSRPWLARIEQAGRRLQHLVDQIVNMLVAGKFETELSPESVDVAALLKQAADDVRPFVELRHQTVVLDLPQDLGGAEWEADKIRDSINHLLLNAVKFTPDGGQVALSAAPVDGSVEIRITDNGSGIEPACVDRLFEPFFTGFDVSRHSSGQYEFGRKGIGLGLSVVKAFVQMHGGTIRADSELGRGTTITFRIPRRRVQPVST